MTFATIDIGTNTTLMLIADVTPKGGVQRIAEAHKITRLGADVGKTQRLSTAGMQRTAATLQDFATLCAHHQVSKIIAVGTSAMRRAKNSQDFIEMVQRSCGITIEIISGEEEAALSYLSAQHDFGNDIVVIDLGGGSTEFIWQDDVKLHEQSLLLGSVVLQDSYGRHDPLTSADIAGMEIAVQQALKAVDPRSADAVRGKQFVGIAGTATTIAAMKLKLKEYDHSQVHGTVVTLTELDQILQALCSRSIAERKKLIGLDPERADVIFAGGLILRESLVHFGFEQFTASDHGVRWGLAYRQSVIPA